jgi:hypothetical protein
MGRLFYYTKIIIMKSRRHNRLKSAAGAFLFCGFLLTSSVINAQTTDSSDTYHLYLEPYLLAPSMSGTIGIGQLPKTFICVPASELFKYFQIGGMLYAEVHNNRFAYTSDLLYASLGQDASSKNGVISGKVTVKQFWWELAGLYKVKPWLEFGVGARINSITNGLNINVPGPSNKNVSKGATWVDPIIVTRLKGAINNKWLLQLRADMGGFGIGSQFAWQLQPDIYYRASRLLELGLGYRIISMDYNKGSGDNRFLYDIEEYGPQLRIGFNL